MRIEQAHVGVLFEKSKCKVNSFLLVLRPVKHSYAFGDSDQSFQLLLMIQNGLAILRKPLYRIL